MLTKRKTETQAFSMETSDVICRCTSFFYLEESEQKQLDRTVFFRSASLTLTSETVT